MSFSDIGVNFLALENHSLYLITCRCGFIQDHRFMLFLTIIQTSFLFYLYLEFIFTKKLEGIMLLSFISVYVYLYLSSKILYNLLSCLIRSQWIFQFFVLVRDSTNLTKPGYYLFERMKDNWNINFSLSAKIRINIMIFLLIKETRL